MTFNLSTPRMIEAARKRDDLIKTATRQFEASGYEGVDLRTLAKACGISTGVIFNNFAGKESLFAGCFPDDHERRRVAEAICLAMGESWLDGPRELSLAAADSALSVMLLKPFSGEEA